MSTLPNIIRPTATADLFSSDTRATPSGKTGEDGLPFDSLMARALSNPTGNKEPEASPNASSNKTGANNLPADPQNFESAAPTFYSPGQSAKSDGPFDYLMARAPLATAGSDSFVAGKQINGNKASADNLPLDSKSSKPATPGSVTSLTNLTPAPNLNAVSSNAIKPVPDKPSDNDGQLDELATRTSLTPAGEKSLVTGQNVTWGKANADNFQIGSKGLTPDAWASGTTSANDSTPTKVGTIPVGKIAVIANQASQAKGQADDLTTNTLLPAAMVKNLAANQNLNPGETVGPNMPLLAKDTKSAAQTSGNSDSRAVSNSDAAQNPAPAPDLSQSTVNPVNVAAQILAAVAVVDSPKVKTSSNIPVAGKPATTLPVIVGANAIAASPIKISSPTVHQNQSTPEASMTVQPDSLKKSDAFDGLAPLAKNEVTDSKIASPLAGQTSAADKDVNADLKTSTLSAKQVDDSQSGLPALSALDPKLAGSAQAIGTPTAQQDALMNNGGKSSKTADLTGKFLPGSVAVVTRGNDLPMRSDQITATNAASASAQNNSATATVSVASPAENFAADDLRSQALERTHDLVTAHAMRLSDTGTDSSLQVVLKPGAGTQLSLELRQRGNGVEAQASLQQGDFKHLSQHWPDLQQRLEQRGIRLAPLTDDGSFAGNDGHTFNHNQNQARETSPEMTFAGSATGTFTQPAARVKAPSGWETWA